MKKTILTFVILAKVFSNQAQVVSTFAGSGTIGGSNGAGITASFAFPSGVCADAAGNIYVADSFNNKIRKITSTGVVSTFAGSGLQGGINGAGIAASFYAPIGVCIDAVGNIYVADNANYKIRKITPDGVVSTFAGSGIVGSTDGTATMASFNSPSGICIDPSGNIYVTDNEWFAGRIRKISPTGVVSTFAGSGESGSTNDVGIAASFGAIYDICADVAGNIYVADGSNQQIRKITPAGLVSTFAGASQQQSGSTDGVGVLATFNTPSGICIDAAGNLYVGERGNHKIRKISPTGVVSTFAGSGEAGSTNGNGIAASFNQPYGVCTDAIGNIYVADQWNHQIRKIASMSASIKTIEDYNDRFQVYPNPSSTFLTIQTNEIIESINIYNSVGSLIQAESKTTFSVEQLPAGIYTVQIKTAKENEIIRFIKD